MMLSGRGRTTSELHFKVVDLRVRLQGPRDWRRNVFGEDMVHANSTIKSKSKFSALGTPLECDF